ncbi:MAG: GTPase [Candidatus Woesearchaeota archaeon]
MSFSDIPKIESDTFYLELAIRRAREECDKRNINVRDALLRTKKKSGIKVRMMEQVLTKSLHSILEKFPKLDELTPFYQDLIKLTLDYPYLKRSFGAIVWGLKKISEFSEITNRKLYASKTPQDALLHHKRYMGRCASICKQLREHLVYLEDARRVMRSFPHIKSGLFTACLVGFPNVGKSTLLNNITGSSAKTANYAFTTKSLNLGYSEFRHQKWQFIDTPGSLNRVEKMNDIEKQAYLAIKHVSNICVFVFDIQNEVEFETQQKLLKQTQKIQKHCLVYLSKTDILPKADIDEFLSQYPEASTSVSELLEKIYHLPVYKDWYKGQMSEK